MKIVRVETLISCGSLPKSAAWRKAYKHLTDAIKAVDWPVGSGKFTVHDQSGKKRGQGSGVKPIKNELLKELVRKGWKAEEPLQVTTQQKPGKLDAVLYTRSGPVAFEWETGNISSSHRALNKMALGLLTGKLAGGILVVPSRAFYKYLTDRVGNFAELEPYLELWKSLPCRAGILEIIVIEHDAVSSDVPRIPKGTDGRALS
jgi:hypothetical protein